MISRPFSLPEVLSRRVLSTTVGGTGGISTISYCAAPPEFEDELEFLRSPPPYSGDPTEEEETVVTEDGGGGDELQLGTVPSLKPIQTAPKTTTTALVFAVTVGCSAAPEMPRGESEATRDETRERDHSNGGHSVHYYMARVQRKMSV